MRKIAKKGGAKKPLTFIVKGSAPASDGIVDVAVFEKYLTDRITIRSKGAKNLLNVTVEREAKNIKVSAPSLLSKRYVKYLTKKFLKKQQLRDYVRVVSESKDAYELRYLNFAGEEEES